MNERDPESFAFRPYLFAAQFDSFISPEYLEAQGKATFVDKHGQRWVREEPTKVALYDMSTFESTEREESMVRELYWLRRLQE